ncbi:hypothetical protein VYU27_004228 [Nannochloropsis oceanica]
MARLKKGYTDEEDGSSTGRWTTEEHTLFEDGLRKYGKQWKRIAEEIPTRTVVQIRTHAQKYFLKLAKIEPATSTSIALKPPNSANHHHHHHHISHGASSSSFAHGSSGISGVSVSMGVAIGGDLPLSLARKKRSVGKSTYRRRVLSLDSEEEEAEVARRPTMEQGVEGGQETEGEEEGWDSARGGYQRGTTLTSRGRVSRPPPHKAASFMSPLPASPSRGTATFGDGSSSHGSGGVFRTSSNGGRRQQKRLSHSDHVGNNTSFNSGSRHSSSSSFSHTLWSALMPSGGHPTLHGHGHLHQHHQATGSSSNSSGGLMVKIPSADDHDDEIVLGEDSLGFPSLLDASHGAGGGGGRATQTPTSVADLYPGVVTFPLNIVHSVGEEEGGVEEEEEDRMEQGGEEGEGDEEEEEEEELYTNYRPEYMHCVPVTMQPAGSCASSTTSSSSASASSSGAAGTTEEEEEEGEEEEEEDTFATLHELAGRTAPDWGEALNEALGALEGVGGTGVGGVGGGDEGHLHAHALQHDERMHHHLPLPLPTPPALSAPARGLSVSSLTDSGSHSSSSTGSYLPSDESDEERSGAAAGARARAGAVAAAGFLEGGEAPPAKRARMSQERREGGAVSSQFVKGSSTVPFMVHAAGEGGREGGEEGREGLEMEEDSDYGYFTTEEELDHMLLNMLDAGTSASTCPPSSSSSSSASAAVTTAGVLRA